MSDTREQLDRLLTLYRKGAISEEALLDQIEQVSAEGPNGSGAADGVASTATESGEGEPVDPHRLVQLLDEFRAAEASGADTLSRWAKMSEDPQLIGGLRVLAAREYGHAVLLEHRLRELGVTPSAEVPSWLAGFNHAILSSEASDVERLGALVAQFSDIERSTERIDQAIEMTAGDELTREVLVAIRIDELATIDWLRAAYGSRNGADEKVDNDD